MSQKKLEEKIRTLQAEFIAVLPDKLGEVFRLFSCIESGWRIEDCQTCVFNLHSLKGSSAALRFTELSTAFSECEKILKSILKAGCLSNLDDRKELVEAFNYLQEYTAQFLDNSIQDGISLEDASTEKESVLSGTNKATFISNLYETKILFVGDAELADTSISKFLLNLSLNFNFCRNIDDAKNLVLTSPPHLVILDLGLSEHESASLFRFAEELNLRNIPCFLSLAKDAFDTRLRSVRALVNGIIEQPVCVNGIYLKIRKALSLELNTPYKVCLVDDQASVGKYFKSVMEEHGLDVRVVTNPMDVFNVSKVFAPDMFIFDLFMPEVNGMELARLVRQVDSYDKIPIVFLTSENSMESKTDALSFGCDDLLPKDMPVLLFVKQILSRLERVKAVLNTRNKDSLTGLMNYDQIMDAAKNLMKVSKHRDKSMVVAILNVDSFKKVNLSYGHNVGDKVILSLSELLHSECGNTSYIGRLGGAEFMMAFFDSQPAEVQLKLDEVGRKFSDTFFTHGKHSFTVTLSTGLSASDNFFDIGDVVSATYTALYAKKYRGQNSTQ